MFAGQEQEKPVTTIQHGFLHMANRDVRPPAESSQGARRKPPPMQALCARCASWGSTEQLAVLSGSCIGC